MKADGRIDSFKALSISNIPKMISNAAIAKRALTHCHNGHEFTKENTYINPKGSRCCIQCRTEYKHRWRNRRRVDGLGRIKK
jgi:hypothetical protein